MLFILFSLILDLGVFLSIQKAREKQRVSRTQEGRYIDAINKFLIGFIDLKLNSKNVQSSLQKAALSNRRVSNMQGLS